MGEWQAVTRSTLKVPNVVTHSILLCAVLSCKDEHVFLLTSFNNTIRYTSVEITPVTVHMSRPYGASLERLPRPNFAREGFFSSP